MRRVSPAFWSCYCHCLDPEWAARGRSFDASELDRGTRHRREEENSNYYDRSDSDIALSATRE